MLSFNSDCKPLPNIEDNTGFPMNINKLTVAYSKNKSIRNLIFPRCLDKTQGPTVSKYLSDPNLKKFSKSERKLQFKLTVYLQKYLR